MGFGSTSKYQVTTTVFSLNTTQYRSVNAVTIFTSIKKPELLKKVSRNVVLSYQLQRRLDLLVRTGVFDFEVEQRT